MKIFPLILNYEEQEKAVREELIKYLGDADSPLDMKIVYSEREIEVVNIKDRLLFSKEGVGYAYFKLPTKKLIEVYKEIQRQKALIYKIRNTKTNEVWVGDSNGVVKFARMIAESIDPDWIEEHRLDLQDIGFHFRGELQHFITDFKIAKSFLETGDDYVISEIGDKRTFLEFLMQGDCVSINEEEK